MSVNSPVLRRVSRGLIVLALLSSAFLWAILAVKSRAVLMAWLPSAFGAGSLCVGFLLCAFVVRGSSRASSTS